MWTCIEKQYTTHHAYFIFTPLSHVSFLVKFNNAGNIEIEGRAFFLLNIQFENLPFTIFFCFTWKKIDIIQEFLLDNHFLALVNVISQLFLDYIILLITVLFLIHWKFSFIHRFCVGKIYCIFCTYFLYWWNG